ncbi:hypothetical protein CDD81_6915 [Ophiocordyceps australis]|uniref:Intron-binding protein aquarius N-terminal domain-containing protein n=1 Tax=Ophiocordyceps australis TaxID=1399860 RepID=A0A2C5X980_9HYPO|nr:hypothetical protein CDD81_6915 [Ophiocordyceps australis]
MSDAKRRKGSDALKAPEPQLDGSKQSTGPSTSAELEQEEHEFVRLARKHWLHKKRGSKVKVKNDVLKQHLWDVLEQQGFQHKSLLLLESLQTLESYLWPGYTQESSNFHVILIALIINVKRREHLETWTLFEDKPDNFSDLFRRILSLLLDPTLSAIIRTQLVCFLIYAFQSLDCVIVRKECAPLVSIGIWQNLSSEAQRERLLDQTPQLRKIWRASLKRFDAADDATKARLRFERSWLYTLLLDFMSMFYRADINADQTLYCERMIEFVSDLESQLPTRRYVNTLLQDLNLLPVIRLSPVYHEMSNSLLRDLHALLAHYTFFAINDQTALSNYGAISKREELESLLEPLTDDELTQLTSLLDIRVSYPDSVSLPVDRRFVVEFLVSKYEYHETFQYKAQNTALLPTEKTLFNREFQRADVYDGSRPLALPKLNLQYLSAGDFLWRAFVLSRCELFYGIRKDIEAALRRLRLVSGPSEEPSFTGFSKMIVPISKPAIVEVVPPQVGQDFPFLVKAEVSVDLQRLPGNSRREWSALRPDDVVFLLSVGPSSPKSISNGQDAQIELEDLDIVYIWPDESTAQEKSQRK